ncbi:AAA family ATPase [Fibrobacter sp.]|uniref:AAA family ATPase n=1 Tax=Fibrobacter sp. TaxID=35828 RepID=UPI00388D3483
MFGKYDADRVFNQYGFNKTLKNDETIEKTAKAFSASEYIGASRNRLNSGILRNQFILLLDPLRGSVLSNSTFSGVTLLHDDQYVLVHQDSQSETWVAYQGNTPNNPRKIYQSITLQSFFDEVLKTKQIIESATSIQGGIIQATTHQSQTIPFTPTQIIYYGVPGCGKSYEVNKVINAELDKYGVTDKEYHKVRCVFHPEYCNADFVGQIYPYVKPDNGGVEYRFKPGPFAEIVRRAYRNPAEPFFLIIEEINRGNAAAIFGEMFHLLDRIRPEDGPEELSGNIYNTGWSSYGVTNIDVNAYVRQKSTDNPEKIEYDDSIPYGDKIKFINNTAVRLPPNLSIYATMNTNDQNVFTMDNAFQRRFKSKMIRNVLNENSAQYKTEIDDTGVCWGDFRKWINEKILLPQTAVLKADDKCLGGWFITGEKIKGVDKIKKEDFAEKVLKYLWDDVFKRNKSGEIFVKDDKVNSLSDLIDAFETSVGFESFEKIFKMNDVDKAKLQKQANT